MAVFLVGNSPEFVLTCLPSTTFILNALDLLTTILLLHGSDSTSGECDGGGITLPASPHPQTRVCSQKAACPGPTISPAPSLFLFLLVLAAAVPWWGGRQVLRELLLLSMSLRTETPCEVQ